MKAFSGVRACVRVVQRSKSILEAIELQGTGKKDAQCASTHHNIILGWLAEWCGNLLHKCWPRPRWRSFLNSSECYRLIDIVWFGIERAVCKL